MWRISAFILVASLVSCAGTSEKDLLKEEERKEAMRDLGEPGDTRSQLSAQLESLKQIRSQMEQELDTKQADVERLKERLEDVAKKLESLYKERKSLLDKGAQKSPSEEGIKKYLRDSEFVAHGGVGTFGTGLDGSLVNIGFTIREVLKGSYTETEVKFEQLPPSASAGVKAFELFEKHGHDYIICFKKGAQEGKYEYCGPNFESQEIIANGSNLTKVKEYLKTAPSETKKK